MKVSKMKDEDEVRAALSDTQMGLTPFVEQSPNGTWEAGLRMINIADENRAQATALKLLQCVLVDLQRSGILPKEVAIVG